jgi:hypothetical protein
MKLMTKNKTAIITPLKQNNLLRFFLVEFVSSPPFIHSKNPEPNLVKSITLLAIDYGCW